MPLSAGMPDLTSRKRLLSDLKPPNPSPPSDLLRRKNPRHLPNLSDCHACHRHVTDSANPKHRLKPLNSLWRIVLLCKECVGRVRGGVCCSYCFCDVVDGDGEYRCPDCRCCVHRECAVRYSSSAPWSYSKLEFSKLGFTVCVDCWLPEVLNVSNRVCNQNRGNEMDMKLSSEGEIGDSVSNEKSVVENGDFNKIVDGFDLIVQPEDEIRSLFERKKVEVKAKEKAIRKAVLAKRASEFADGAIKLTKKKSEIVKNECLVGCDGGGDVVMDDAELAVRLHRAINSSPRISRRLLLGNPRSLSIQSLRVGNGDSMLRPPEPKGGYNFTYKRRGNSKSTFRNMHIRPTEICIDSKLNENLDETCSKTSACRTPCEGGLKHELLVYRRKCKKCSDCQEKGEVIPENDFRASKNKALSMQDVLINRQNCINWNKCHIKEAILENGNDLEDRGFNKQDMVVYRRKCKMEAQYLVVEDKIPADSMSFETPSCHTQDEVHGQKSEKFIASEVDCKVISKNSIISGDEVLHKQDLLVYRRKCKMEDVCLEIGREVPEYNMFIENRSGHLQDELVCKLNGDGGISQFKSEGTGICNKFHRSDSFALKYKKRVKTSSK